MNIRSRRILLLALIALALVGCGGQLSDSFAKSIYVEIKSSGTLNPSSVALPIGYRIVFLNHDHVDHAINWENPLNLTATAPAGGRAWFELPQAPSGTVLSYHLDTSGSSGSVTMSAVTP